jgi:hypothetical protein
VLVEKADELEFDAKNVACRLATTLPRHTTLVWFRIARSLCHACTAMLLGTFVLGSRPKVAAAAKISAQPSCYSDGERQRPGCTSPVGDICRVMSKPPLHVLSSASTAESPHTPTIGSKLHLLPLL